MECPTVAFVQQRSKNVNHRLTQEILIGQQSKALNAHAAWLSVTSFFACTLLKYIGNPLV